MIVTINGTIASGKSAIGKMLAETLNYEYFSTGQIYREEAESKGLTVKEYLDYCDSNPDIHRSLEQKVKTYVKGKDNIIIDGRMAWYAIPDSLKLYLHCSENTAALRILGTKRTAQNTNTLDDCLADIKNRYRVEQEQFKSIYGVDIHDMKQYDLCVKTDTRSLNDIVSFCQMAIALFQVEE